MDKDAGWRAVDQRRVVVAELAGRPAGPEAVDRRRSLCDGWTVRDVGAHLSIAAVVVGRARCWPWVLRSRAQLSTG